MILDRFRRNELDSIVCEFGSLMRTISYLGRHKSLDCSQPPASRNLADPRFFGLREPHLANPSSIFSASFSSFQNSASNSFAGVGGW